MNASDRAAILGAHFSGELSVPGDGGYDACRKVFNGMHDKRPALIARCRTAADVAAAVTFAREQQAGDRRALRRSQRRRD